MKRVCIYSNVGHFIELYEIQLEIAQRHLDNGDSVEFLFCDGLIPICEINLKKEMSVCLHCISRRNQGLKLLKGKFKKRELLAYSAISDINKIRNIPKHYKDIKALTSLKINNFEVGKAVYSSIADIRREHEPDLQFYEKQVSNFIISSSRIYFCMNRYIKKYIPELVYVYNGRHALEQPVIASCKENNINFITHEFATNGGYRLCNNTQPQDYSERTKKIKEYLKHDLTDSEYEKGKIYFEKRVGSRQCHITLVRKKNDYKIIENRWNKLDGVKKRQVLPDNWDFKKYNIVIFTSSELEKKVVNQYTHNKIYDNQINAITHIINAARSPHSNIHFYIKLHPSYKFWDNSPQEYKNIVNLELPSNSSFIFPESQIDNYFLINKSNKVVCFRSTAGLESSYFGKPTIFLEDHIIAKLSSVYYPHDQNNAIKLILNENLPPLPNTDSIKYGSYLMSEGILPKYYHRDPNVPYEQNWGLYRGRKVVPSALTLLFIDRFLHNQKLQFINRKIHSLEKKIYNILYKFH